MRPIIIVTILSLIMLFAPVSAVHGQTKDEALDEIMNGFGDGENESNIQEGNGKNPDTEGLDELLNGFDESPSPGEPTARTEPEAPLFGIELDGYVKFGLAVNVAHEAPRAGQTDWRGLSRARGELQLETERELSDHWELRVSGKGEWDGVYGLRGRERFTADVLDAAESDLELRDTYLLGTFDNIDLRLGRQVVVWGKSDNIRVTDVLNPLDMREPGLTDLEDLRLPLAMARMDYYFGDWQLSGMAIPEIRFNKTPGFGSDFFPSPVPLPPETVPSDGGANTEWAAALSGVFSGWDAALYAARLFDDQTHVSMLPGTARARLTREHARLTMLGAAVNVARGNWIYKAETAWLDGLEFFNAPGADFSRIDALAGVEYAGFGEATVSLEIANRRLIGYEERLRSAPDSAERDRFQYALRATRDYLNDTLTLTALALVYGAEGEDGALGRLTAEYDVTDAWTVTAGVVSYQAGELPTFADIGDNDRFYFEFKRSF